MAVQSQLQLIAIDESLFNNQQKDDGMEAYLVQSILTTIPFFIPAIIALIYYGRKMEREWHQ